MTLFWLCCAWLIGVLLAPILPFQTNAWILLAAAAAASSLWLRHSWRWRMLFALLAFGFLAGARAAWTNRPPPVGVSRYNDSGQSIGLRGTIASFPDHRDRHTQFLLKLDQVRLAQESWTPVDGRLLARVDPLGDWRFGDRIELHGLAETAPQFEGFDYRAYLERQGVLTVFDAIEGRTLAPASGPSPLVPIYRYRALAHARLLRLLPEPAAALVSGITLGIESGIPDEVRATFDATGTTHIIAISGFNISIVAALFTNSFGRWLGTRRGALAAGAAVMVYTLLVGADAAVVRAAIMAAVALLGRRLGRASTGYAALGAAALLMTAIDPQVVWDVGFQLSFAATLGLVVFGERLSQAAAGFMSGVLRFNQQQVDRWLPPLSEYLLMTLAAQITTLPIIAYHFQRISWIAPAANLLILPAQPPLMVLGGLAAIAGSLWLPAGQVLAWLTLPFAAYTLQVVKSLAALPMASSAIPPLTVWGLLLAYALVAAVSLGLRVPVLRARLTTRWQLGAAVSVALLGLGSLLAWQTALSLPDQRLRMTFLDVTPGAGVLIETPSGRHVLIDGGGSGLALSNALDQHLPSVQRDLDWLVITQSEGEAIAGLTFIDERYAIGGLLVASDGENRQLVEIMDGLRQAGRPVLYVQDGARLSLGGGAQLTFRAVDSGGFAMQVSYGRLRAVLAPAAGRGWTESLSRYQESPVVHVLLLPGAGDVTLSPPQAVRALQPLVVQLTSDETASAQPPPTSLQQALAGGALIRSNEYGWSRIVSDGERMWLFSQRSPLATPPSERSVRQSPSP